MTLVSTQCLLNYGLFLTGLWIVDLSVTQILQERVEENRRGVINGVQDSMNNSLDLLKCVLVIFLPSAQSFGILILLSFASISLGWASYSIFFCQTTKRSTQKSIATEKSIESGNQLQFDNTNIAEV